MVNVLASTTAVPTLLQGLAQRRTDGRHARDEWQDEVYVLTNPFSPEQGEVVARLVAHLLPLSDALGLCMSTPAAIGTPGEECRAPAVVVFDIGTPRTTPVSLSTAELVIDVLADGVPGGDRMGFYGRWRVREVLEVNIDERMLRLHRASADGWDAATHSQVLGFDVQDDTIVSLRGRERIVWPRH